MSEENRKILIKVQGVLERLLLGNFSPAIEDVSNITELNQVIELVNMLSINIVELNTFAKGLASGDMDTPSPGRRNYLAATLKELHSKLSSFVWAANQVQNGHIVERMDYMGELSDSLNALLEKVISNSLSNTQEEKPSPEAGYNSWKYHQLFLVLSHLPFAFVAVDESGKVFFINLLARKLLGNIEHLLPQNDPNDNGNLRTALSSINMRSLDFPYYQEMYDISTSRWLKITTDQIQFPGTEHIYMHTIEDISEWKTNEKELKISATVDDLTGTYTRNVGMDALEAAIKATRLHVVSCAAFIDIDKLKYINDTFGHNEGDYAISTIAEVLTISVRDCDTVSRFGGDEFLVVFHGCKLETTEKIIGRMYERVEHINATNKKPFPLAFSHGITQINCETSSNVQEIIMLMDKKMYARKAAKNITKTIL